MKTVKEATEVTLSGVGETKRATIKASAKLFNFFSEQIYSDKYTAIWRELVANAIDAQKINGETRPPVVTAPSMLEPYAKVRDFGCSMDHEFMMDKFMAFTDASTKEHSDEFIGGFGIGSKAPLAYTEQYSIKCYMGGEVRVYSIFKDDEGCPSIAFLSQDKTSEPDGVEVGFPVRQEDIERFTSTLVNTLRYFRPLPILEGTELELKEVEYDAKGERWGIRSFEPNSNRQGRIIIGGVAYPLDTNSLSYKYTLLRQYANMGLDLFLEIGEANIALSREHVTHDDALLTRLEKIIQNIGPEYGKQLSKKFDSAKTLWEAKRMLADLIEEADYSMTKVFQNYAVWKGDKITPNIMSPKLPLLYVAYGEYGWHHSRRSSGASGIPSTEAVTPRFRAWTENARFQPHTFEMIVWDDAKDKPSLRIRTCVEENPGTRILFVRNNAPEGEADVTKQQFLDAIGNPPLKIVKNLSDYKPAKVARSSGAATARPFKCWVRKSKPYMNSHDGMVSSLPAEGGLYIVMHNFQSEESSENISIALRSNPKNVVWMNLTDFKASGVDVNPDWYSVKEGIQKVKDEYRSKHSDLPEAEGFYQAWGESGVTGFLHHINDLSKLSNFPKRGPLLQILRLFERHNEVNSGDHSAVRTKLLGVDGSKHKDRILKLAEKAKAKHPLLAEIMEDYTLRRRASDALKNRLF